jgi:transposase
MQKQQYLAHRQHLTLVARAQDQLRDPRSVEPKHELMARLKAVNARRALFFCACVGIAGMSLANNISARKFSRREVRSPAKRLQAGVRQRERVTRGHIPPPPLTSFERFQPESA